MSDEQPKARRRRLVALASFAGAIVIALVIAGLTYGSQLIAAAHLSSIADEAADAVAEMPGVIFTSAEVDTTLKPYRRRPSLVPRPEKAAGTVTMTVTLEREVTAGELASALLAARERFVVDEFAKHDVALEFRVSGTETHLFDGWGGLSAGPGHDEALVADAAALALDLAPGTWIDLAPDTYEDGPFLRGSPTFFRLMPTDASQAITVATTVPTVEAAGFLAAVASVEAKVKDAVDVVAGIQVRSPGELSETGPTYSEAIFSTEANPALRAAWGGLVDAVEPLTAAGIAANILISTTRNTVHRPTDTVKFTTYEFDLSVELRDQVTDCVLADPAFDEVARSAIAHLRATDFAFEFTAAACGRTFIDEERARG